MANSVASAMNIVMIASTVVSLVFLLFRLFSKYLAGAKVGVDDAVLVLSWMLFVVFVGLSIHATNFGLGKHIGDADPTQLPNLLYLLPIGQFFAVVSVAVSKSSFILTLVRLVEKFWQKAVLWFMLVTINASMFSIAIVQFYQCAVPPTPGCVANNVVIGLGTYAAGYSAGMDLVLTVFPFLVIWNLQIKRSDKIGIISSMSLGIVAGVVGIYKTSTIPGIARDSDFTYGTAFPLIWLAAEVSATIIAASIPFYRPLVRLVMGTTKKDSYNLSKRSRPSTNPLGRQHEQLDYGDDNDSDKIILKDQPRIMRHTSITVEHAYPADAERGGRAAPGTAVSRDSF